MGPDQEERAVSFYADINGAAPAFQPLTDKGLCFECGGKITGAAVGYDGYAVPGRIESIFFHPACAALVGQRLITDGFPNRRKD